jgi:O-antigen/teichoic acid export membrane protein
MGTAATAIGETGPAEPGRTRPETHKHIRGSTVLFAGRLLSLALNLATQVLIVRLLTKADYGAFAYALAFGPAVRTIISVGHQEVLTRFLALYEERRAYDKLFGTILMKLLTIVSAGIFFFILAFALRGFLAGNAIDDPQAIGLLLVLIWLAPFEAIEYVFEAIFAVFSRPRAIFFRKYLLTPGTRFVFVVVLLAVGGSAMAVAIGYVLAAVVGTIAYTAMAVQFFRRQGLLDHFDRHSIQMPFREVLGFSVPMLSSDLVFISMTTFSVILLGRFAGALDVADYRAIFPVARLNTLVFTTFGLLFTPLAARMFARHDRAGMSNAYWHTAVWLAVFSFPILALTGPMAEATTVLLFGQRYHGAAILLAVLSGGFYFNAALGYNTLTLMTHGELRYVTKVNIAAAIVNIALSVVAIPRYGAVGVAVANTVTLVVQNVLNQLGLGRRIGVPLFEWRYVRPYAVITVAVAALGAIQLGLHPAPVVGVACAGLATVAVFALNRDVLEIEATFPELMRVPGVRRLVASAGATSR